MIQLSAIEGFYERAEYVGSRVTCDPPPTDTDLDILILVPDALTKTVDMLLNDDGWTLGGSRIVSEENHLYEHERFTSHTKNEVNIIMTASVVFYERFLLATKVCKAINLMYKNHRVILFQSILYGNAPL